MELAKQNVPDKPSIPSDDILRLRASLILEEALETIDGLGCEILYDGIHTINKNNFSIVNVKKADLVKIADGCADISVVTIGTLSACGIPDEKLLQIVDENNLEKFGEGHTIREDGKLIKPINHQPPNIKDFLKNV
jgi:predicted HAD superfamily Cof-like phosphohydrolase